MSKSHIAILFLAAAGLFAPANSRSQDLITNRLSASARFGFNITARFKGLSTLPLPPNTRTTPNGDAYNYDDGYVLKDATGNLGGQTWYWGYDNSSKQAPVGANAVLMSTTTYSGPSPETDAKNDPSYGVELLYQRMLWAVGGKCPLGFELAGNYQNISISDDQTMTANATRTTYPFPYAPGTTPPLASPGSPYLGSPQGPGFLIGVKPGTPTTTLVPGAASISGHRSYDADIWGLRLGPYFQVPIGQKFDVSVSMGLAGAFVNGDVSWNEKLTLGGASGATVSGSGNANDVLWGFYATANAAWRFKEHWSVIAGVQFQDVGEASDSFNGRQVDLNLRESYFVTVGLAWNF